MLLDQPTSCTDPVVGQTTSTLYSTNTRQKHEKGERWKGRIFKLYNSDFITVLDKVRQRAKTDFNRNRNRNALLTIQF